VNQQTLAPTGIVADISLADLCAIADQLRTEHPNAGARLDHASFIATFREVERGTSPSTWWVQSETDPNQTYMVTAGQRCCCQDFARRGEQTWCKHLIAVAIVERAERLAVDREQADGDDLDDIGDVDQPIDWELTEAAYELLDTLGEPCAIEPARPVGTCTRIPMSATAQVLADELFGPDGAA
jgi:hypothetical protein